MIKGIMNGLLGEVYSYAYDQIGYKRSKKAEEASKLHDILYRSLNEEQKKLFESFREADLEERGDEEIEKFTAGFRYGLLLGIDSCENLTD